jgi:hypothetical protein
VAEPAARRAPIDPDRDSLIGRRILRWRGYEST